MGIGSLRHPGMHDDRPPYKQPLQKEEETFKASFGDVKFNLPAHGSLPDIPVKTAETDAILRDLPNVEQLDYESDDVGGGEGKQYGKSYLKNPYGADFIRLEIDSDRYTEPKNTCFFLYFVIMFVMFVSDISITRLEESELSTTFL